MDLIVKNARLSGRDDLVDLAISDGKIQRVDTGIDEPAARVIDANAGLVIPPFVDPHFHLDKVLSRRLLGATSPQEAFARAREVKTHFTAADVEARVSEALRLAVAHGIGLIRTHVDIDSFTGLVSLEGVLAARERFSASIEVEIVAFPQEGLISDPPARDLLVEGLRMGADLVGGLPEFESSVADQRRHLEIVFEIAEQEGVRLDPHIDYLDVPELKTLEMLAEMTIERGMQGRVNAGHCCALATYPDEEAQRVIGKVREAEIKVSVMPMANLQMLGGTGRTPTHRGSSRMAELLDAGVPTAAGSDNMFDIWYRFNRMDPAELALITCLSGGMKTDADVQTAFEMTNIRAAEVLGRGRPVLEPDTVANFVVFDVDNVVDVMRNLPGRRITVREGRVVGGREGSLWAGD